MQLYLVLRAVLTAELRSAGCACLVSILLGPICRVRNSFFVYLPLAVVWLRVD